MKKVFIMIAMVFILSCFSFAMPTTQYVKEILSPYYVNSMSQNVRYDYIVDIESPDGMTHINTAILTLDAWINPTRTFNAWMNNVQCNTKNYTVSTTFSSSGRAEITFDCTNAVLMNQKNTVSFSVTGGNIGSSTSWIELTYQNNPIGDMEIHGTEYDFGDIGKVWLQLLNNNGSAITNGVCYVDIYTPQSTIFLESAIMSNMLHDGIYYYDFDASLPKGVYPVIAKCFYVAGQVFNYAGNISIVNGTLDGGTISDTQVVDGNYQLTTETSALLGNPRRYDSRMLFNNSNVCTNVSESLLTGISIGFNGRWNSNVGSDVITMSLWNYTSSSWFVLSNTITGVGTGTKSVTNSLSFNNISKQGFVNGSGNVILRFQDTTVSDSSSTGLDFDQVYISCDQLASPVVQQVKGSSEVHINAGEDYFIDGTYSFLNNSFTANNFTASSYSGYFSINFTVESLVVRNSTNEIIAYQGFHSLPCNAIMKLYAISSNGSLIDTPFYTERDTGEDHCSITFVRNLSVSENYDYVVYARNVWEDDIRSTNTGILASYPLIKTACDFWTIANAETPFPYIVPKNQTNENHTAYYRACANYLDDKYRFDIIYNKTLVDKGLIIDSNTFLQFESDYVSMQFATKKLIDVESLLINNVLASGMYSQILLLNPLNASVYGNQFFANISTTQLIYNRQNVSIDYNAMSFYVWNYTARYIHGILI